MTSFLLFLLIFSLNLIENVNCIDGGMLQVQESESRQVQDLCGMWNFRADNSPSRNEGQEKKWFQHQLFKTGPVMDMPVPSSYNDITTDESLRDFVGWVWYDREVFTDWKNKRVMLRIDSAHYYTSVYVNGKLVTEHNGGHLPFEADITDIVSTTSANLITIAVNNTLSGFTIPPGSVTFHGPTHFPNNYMHQNLQFDFFNYAGIHRRVRLYATPHTYVDDVNITTSFKGNTGLIEYDVSCGGPAPSTVKVDVLTHNGSVVASSTGLSGNLSVPNAQLWWPYTMNDKQYGYQYTLKITALSNAGVADVYRQKFGIRTVAVSSTQILINDKPFYCHGVAKHEDSDLRGKGLDFALIARDFHMLKWLGVNCFRTSHYPYAEEIMDQADKQGIVVIDECPAVGLVNDHNFSNRTKAHHLETIREMIRRDKNRPAVIMWSIANEPRAANKHSAPYLTDVIKYTKTISHNRLVTYVASGTDGANKAIKYVDVACVNKYFGWYSDIGEPFLIPLQLPDFLTGFYNKYGHPVIMTEYGAETIPGMHNAPALSFTEDYQSEVLMLSHKVFDDLKKKFLVGEMVWNFADFMTKQATSRILGNHKGLLTRQRQPKMGAHVIRARYWTMINETMSLSTNHSSQQACDLEQHGSLYYMYGNSNKYKTSIAQPTVDWIGNMKLIP